jgi:hypothetical protein
MNTMLPAAGWLPDPQSSGQLRYWDGSQWTSHIHPAPAAETSSLARHETNRLNPTYDSFGDLVLFRERTHGAAKSDVTVTAKRLTVAKRSIAFTDVDALTYDLTAILSFGFNSGTSYTISLQGKGFKTVGLTTQSLPMRTHREEPLRQYNAVLQLLEHHLVNQLVQRLAEQIVGGKEHDVGGVLLSRDGIRWKRRFLPWTEFCGAAEQGREVLIFGPQAETLSARTFVSFANTRILVRLCDAIAYAFSHSRQD